MVQEELSDKDRKVLELNMKLKKALEEASAAKAQKLELEARLKKKEGQLE